MAFHKARGWGGPPAHLQTTGMKKDDGNYCKMIKTIKINEDNGKI